MLRRILLGVMQARGGALGMLQTLLAQVGITAVNVVTGVLTARLLGPLGRGEFAAALMWFMLPSLLATAGLQSGLVYQMRRDPSQAASVGAAGLLVATVVYVPVALLCLAVLPTFMHEYRPHVVMLARLGVSAGVMSVFMILARQCLLGTRNMHLFNLSQAYTPIAYLLLLGAVLPFHVLTPTIAVLAQMVATGAVLAPTSWWAMRGWRWQRLRPLSVLRPLTRYSARAAVIDLVNVFAWQIDRLVLIGLIAPAEFGLYAVAVSLARLMSVMQTAISSVTLADLSHKQAHEIEMYIHRAVRIIFWLLLAACVAGWMAGGMLMRLVYGDGFAAAVPIFHVALLESASGCISQILVEAFLASGRPAYPARVQVAYCVLLFGAMLLLAPLWGGLGAALAMFGAMVGKIVLLLVGLRRIDLGLPGLVPRRADIDLIRKLLRGPGASLAG